MVIKMNNKVLIQLIVPEIEEKYDLFIPINRRVGTVINLISKAIFELNNDVFISNKKRLLYNHNTGLEYSINKLIRETDIRNGTILVLI